MQRITQLSLNTLLATGLVASLGLTGCEKKTTSPIPPATASATSASISSSVSTTAATSTPSVTAIAQSAATATVLLSASPAVSASTSTTATAVKSTSATPFTNSKNLITQPTVAGTPEDVLKKSVNALVNGNAKEAASYYHIEGVNMAQVLTEQQPTFQKQLKHLELSPTEYNADKTQAGIFGSLTLANSPTPKQTLYKFQKINGQWKIVG